MSGLIQKKYPYDIQGHIFETFSSVPFSNLYQNGFRYFGDIVKPIYFLKSFLLETFRKFLK